MHDDSLAGALRSGTSAAEHVAVARRREMIFMLRVN
jgi:hypothetical protein